MIGNPWLLLLVGWGTVALCFLAGWAYATRRGDASIVDALWGYGLGVLGVEYALLADGAPEHRILIGVLSGLTGLKIGTYVLVTRVLGKEEDGRYLRLREKWGANATRNFLVFFQAQGLLDLVLSTPFLLAALDQGGRPQACVDGAAPLAGADPCDVSIPALAWAGAALWLVASVGETVADRQLTRFRRDPRNRGQVCDEGLWRVSRHPNYFFQILTWVAFALVATAAPWGWLGFLAPLVITLSIILVTGIPPTEAQSVRSRGEAYRRYQRTTPVLVPWRRRRRDAGPPRGLDRILYWIPPETGRGR
ncbi:MAG: DUF1295 domain-containing protein [Thermoleophilia bacterium]